jgi:hypothetical protein
MLCPPASLLTSSFVAFSRSDILSSKSLNTNGNYQPICLDAQNVLKKANETPLKLEGNLLNVSSVFEPTHDRSILLAKNINPETNEETFKSFVEVKKKADVLNLFMGKMVKLL